MCWAPSPAFLNSPITIPISLTSTHRYNPFPTSIVCRAPSPTFLLSFPFPLSSLTHSSLTLATHNRAGKESVSLPCTGTTSVVCRALSPTFLLSFPFPLSSLTHSLTHSLTLATHNRAGKESVSLPCTGTILSLPRSCAWGSFTNIPSPSPLLTHSLTHSSYAQ